MPYGLFDYEDAMEPMGLSPQAPDFVPARTQIATNAQIAQYNQSIIDQKAYKDVLALDPSGASKIPQNLPSNPTRIITRAIPENPPASGFGFGDDMRTYQSGIPATAQKFAYMGAENSPPQKVTTMAIPENGPIQQNMTDAYIGSEAPPRPVTMAHPESGTFPTPPSGQCPAGYQSSNQSSSESRFFDNGIQYNIGSGLNTNSNPYGLTAGQQIVGPSTGKPFNVNQAGNTWQDITNFAPRIAYASR